MNDKSRNIHAACAASTASNLSDNKFLKDYYNVVKPYLDDGLIEQMPRFPSVQELRTLAEQAFINSYGLFPTCTVYAPGCLTIAGKSTDFAESKSLSMAIQLVTLIVGKRRYSSNWCQVTMLSEKTVEEKTIELNLNDENPCVSCEESWIRYLKGAMQSFKAKRAYIPGCQLVIASSLPVERGFGSNSALVVAIYTFLEAITNTYTRNVVEKTLACYLAKKYASDSSNCRITDILTSILASENTILSIDSQNLTVEPCNWYGIDVEFVLIELGNDEKNIRSERHANETRCKQIVNVLNTMPRWNTHPLGTSMMECLFSQEILEMTSNVIEEDKRIEKMTNAIRGERWEMLGKLLWENHRSACKYFTPEDIDPIASMLKTIEGVLGVCVTGHGTSLIVLVRRSNLKSFVSFLKRVKISERYYLMTACKGATTVYTYERRLNPWHMRNPSHQKLTVKYYVNKKQKH